MSAFAVARDAVQRLAPSLRATAGRLAGDTWARTLAYAAYTLTLFLVFLLATFPHEALLRRLIDRSAQGPLTIAVSDVTLGWPFAYRIGEARIAARGADPLAPLLLAQQVRVAPSLLGLLRGRPYPLSLRAALYGGAFTGKVDLRTDAPWVDATVTDLDLARYSGVRALGQGVWRGRVNARVDVRGDGRKPTSLDGLVSVHATAFAVEAAKFRGITIPDLHFADIRFAAALKNGRLEVTEFVADGQELGVSGTGSIVLRAPLEASMLGLEITLTPATAAPDGLRLALKLLPGSPGEGGARTIAIGGTLAQPRAR